MRKEKGERKHRKHKNGRKISQGNICMNTNIMLRDTDSTTRNTEMENSLVNNSPGTNKTLGDTDVTTRRKGEGTQTTGEERERKEETEEGMEAVIQHEGKEFTRKC